MLVNLINPYRSFYVGYSVLILFDVAFIFGKVFGLKLCRWKHSQCFKFFSNKKIFKLINDTFFAGSIFTNFNIIYHNQLPVNLYVNWTINNKFASNKKELVVWNNDFKLHINPNTEKFQFKPKKLSNFKKHSNFPNAHQK